MPQSLNASMTQFLNQFRPMLRLRWLQLSALTLLLSAVGVIALQLKFCVLDVDIWWHLKVGDWIVEHLAVPHTGILSRTAANRPWVAYSWGYEILLSRAYAWFGLIGIGALGTLLTVAIAYAVFWMIRRLSGRFWLAFVGSGIVCSAFLFNGMPRPFFFSIVFYAITLTLLFEANRSGNFKLLYWLPPIFMLWANLHIQFVYGLFPVGLLFGIALLFDVGKALAYKPESLLAPTLPARKLGLLLAACIAATLIGPNFYHPYISVIEYSKAKFPYQVILELQPLSFGGFSHFTELFIAAAGFYAVGYRKKLDLFKLALLAAASVVAFRTMRDAWFICLSAAACVGDLSDEDSRGSLSRSPDDPIAQSPDLAESWFENAGVAVAVALLLVIFSRGTDFTQRGIDRAISATYPVNAINFLRQNPVRGPIYNNLNWGGFLMWYMPEYPVAIDGRNDLYGDDLDRLFYQSQSADTSYMSDPYLNESGVVLLDSDLPLAKILTADPRFELRYRDQIATVYSRR